MNCPPNKQITKLNSHRRLLSSLTHICVGFSLIVLSSHIFFQVLFALFPITKRFWYKLFLMTCYLRRYVIKYSPEWRQHVIFRRNGIMQFLSGFEDNSCFVTRGRMCWPKPQAGGNRSVQVSKNPMQIRSLVTSSIADKRSMNCWPFNWTLL